MSRMSRFDWHNSRYRSPKPASRRRSLRLEPLEDRRMLAVLTVNSNFDGPVDLSDSVVTLRDAIAAANSNVAVSPGGPVGSGADTIEFAAALSGDTISLTNGQLAIIETLIIDASSLAANVTIDAQQQSRVLHFSATSGDLTLIGLNVVNGYTAGVESAREEGGAGIRFDSSGALSLFNSSVSGNTTTADTAYGGGINSYAGSVVLTGSTVSGNSTTGAYAPGGGIWTHSGAIALTGSTVSGNQTTGEYSHGGGIYTNTGTVTITGTTVSGNSTTGRASDGAGLAAGVNSTRNSIVMITGSTFNGNSATGVNADGGGMRTYANAVTITGSTINGNTAADRGGGIKHSGHVLTITDSTISGNIAADSGGGMFITSQTATISSCTISDNTAAADGGGIYCETWGGFATANTTISNTTISGNFANTWGGGINNAYGLLRIEYSTITDNSTNPIGGQGDGVWNFGDSFSRTEVLSSIIAGNDDGDDVHTYSGANVYVSLGYNLIGGGNELASFNQSGDQSGVTNPLLAPLAFNGGPTLTHALLPGSPALDSGNPSFAAPPNSDQRGTPFVRVFGGRIDIGAFEAQPINFVVDTNVDESDGDYSLGDLSLREAIELANINPFDDSITFDPLLSGDTISLTMGELAITDTLTIDASALAQNVTIDAQQNSRVLNFSATSGDLTLNGLNVVNGYTNAANQGGGGIHFGSSGALTVTGSTVSGNSTKGGSGFGGGIFSYSGNVTLIDSTVSGNGTENSSGGGIATWNGDISLTGSTVSGNSTVADAAGGAGIFSYTGTVTLYKSAVSGNNTVGSNAGGGGIQTATGDVFLTNSTVSGNSTTGTNADGGGIRTRYGSVTLTNSTLSGNSTIGSSAEGGGIMTNFAAVALISSTVYGNSSGSSGGGVFLDDSNKNPAFTIQNSIVAGNTAVGAGPEFIADPDNTLTVTHSLIGNNAGTALAEAQMADSNGNLIGSAAGAGVIDALLGPLQNNGGPTKTHALLPGSPAIDAGLAVVKNVALGGTATQSSEFGNSIFPASNALDGDLTNFTHTNVSDNMASWQVDLDGVYTISEIVLHNRDDYPPRLRDITVEVLNADGVAMFTSELLNPENVLNDPEALTIDLLNLTGGPVVGSTVRVSRTADPDNSGGGSGQADQNVLSLGEVLVNATPAYDQRGAPFTRFSGLQDMGAYEAQTLSLIVDTNVDESDGDYSPGDLSLREAIELANANSGADSIAFDPLLAGATINLDGSELQVTETLTIDASALTTNVTIDAQQQSRVLRVGSGVTADISGLTLTGGLADRGAGLRIGSSSTVSLADVIVRGNESTSTGFDSGGGVWNDNGSTLTIIDCVIADNTSAGNGGGVWNRGNLSIARSTISGNTATGSFSSGGGVVNYFGDLTITDSTLSGNSSTYNGGGIYSVASADLETTATRITGSTISGNTAVNGGGLFNYLGLTEIRYSTITANEASGEGDGVWSFGNQFSSTRTEVASSIISGNIGEQDVFTNNPINGFFSGGYNLVGYGNIATDAFVAAGDVSGINDPMLTPLADNGGPTQTHALLSGSLAMDTGNPAFASPPTFDQRGAPFFARVFGGRIDIGAFEAQTLSLVVDTYMDEADGDYSPGDLSLREAIELANINPGADIITFDAALSGSTISLAGSELDIVDTLTVDASSLAANVTIDAQQQSRVLHFSATSGDLTLNGLNIINGYTTAVSQGGGGIRFDASGVLTLTKSTISGSGTTGNSAHGGAIYAYAGAVTLSGSTVDGNSTTGFGASGGGIFTYSGAVTLTNSSVSGNSTTGSGATGGGIGSQQSAVNVINSTVSGNSTSGDIAYGGGISASSGNVTLTGSTVSGNNTSGSAANGGGAWAFSGDVIVTNSTFSGNSTAASNASGGGLWAFLGDVTFTNSTISGNSSGASGGGLFVNDNDSNPSLTIQNSIVAGNAATVAGPDLLHDPQSTLTVTNSLIGDNAGTSLAEAQTADSNGNLIGSEAGAGVIDALLGPLQNNGGPTATHALLPRSPAIDAGDDALAVALTYDQRGAPFSRFFSTLDMGAYEAQTLSLVVSTNIDESDGDYSPGNLSLREAIELANANLGADLVTFDTALAGSTISLTHGELVIAETLTIDASSLSANVTIDAQQQSRVLKIVSSGDYTLSGLNVVNGTTTENDQGGAGIWFRSSGALTIKRSTVSGNRTMGNNAAYGGGIYCPFGTLTLTSSTISANSSVMSGGGIFAFSGAVTFNDSTVTGNSTTGGNAYGGGVYSEGPITLTNSSVIGNSTLGSSSRGGGIAAKRGAVTITNSTVSGNTTTGSGARGGGIYTETGAVSATNSTISGNSTLGQNADGGGIFTWGGAVTTRNSTVSGNSVSGVNADGGGISVIFGSLTLTGSTISGNSSARSGGGVFIDDNLSSPASPFTSENSIVVSNSAVGDGPDLLLDPQSMLNVVYSLIGDNASTSLAEAQTPDVNGNLIGSSAGAGVIDALLAPLQNNGGLTETHALLPGSPAIDAGDPAAMAGVGDVPLYDQRDTGFDRVVNDRVDIGAFEVQQVLVDSADFDGDGDVDGADFLMWQRGFGKTSAAKMDGDANNDSNVNADDLNIWQNQYGQPASIIAVSSLKATTFKSEDLATTRASLVDAAMALEWIGVDDSEESNLLLYDPEEISLSLLREEPVGTTSTDSSSMSTQASTLEKDETISPDETWLSDELLEQVFA